MIIQGNNKDSGNRAINKVDNKMGKGAATLNDSVVIIGAKSNKKGEPLQMQRKSIHSLVN